MHFLPIVLSLSFYAATVYSYLYLCFTTFEAAFYEQCGFSSGESGFATLGVGVGSILRCVISGVAADSASASLARKPGGDPKAITDDPWWILHAR